MARALPLAGLALLLALGVPAVVPASDLSRAVDAEMQLGFLRPQDGIRMGDDSRSERHRGWRGGRGCSTLDAVGQARDQGFRRPAIADVSRRSVVVEGHGRYGWGRMVFANMPGCPLIAR